MDIFALNPEQIFSFFLTFFRVSIVLFLLPFFGGKVTPNPLKAAMTLILAFALWPQLSFPGQAMPASMWAILLMIFGELTLGLILSLLVNVLFAAVQTGGNLIGFQMGFAMINVADPMTGTNEVITAHFMYMITVMTFLTLNGHLYLLQGLAESFRLVPPGSLYLSPQLSTQMLEFAGQIFVLAIRIAAPVTVAIFLVDLALALIGRAAPQMHVLVFGFPIKICVGFIFLGLLFTVMARYVGDYIIELGIMFPLVLNLVSPGS